MLQARRLETWGLYILHLFLLVFVLVSDEVVSMTRKKGSVSRVAEITLSTVNKSGTPERVMGNTMRTIRGEGSVGMLLANGRSIVHGRLSTCACPGRRVRVIGTARIVRATRPPIGTVHNGGSSSVIITVGVIGGKRTSTFMSTKDSKTILIKKRILMNEVGNIREPPLTPLVPALGNISLLVSYKTGMSTHPSRLMRFTGVKSVCVRDIVKGGGPAINVIGVNTRRRGKGTLIGRAFPLLGRYPSVGFVKDIRTQSVPCKTTSIVIYRTFTNGVVLGLCRNITKTLLGGIGGKVLSSLHDGVKTLLIGPTLGNMLGSFSADRCNNTPLLNLGKLMMGARKDSGSGRMYGSVVRYITFGRRGVGRGVGRTVRRRALRRGGRRGRIRWSEEDFAVARFRGLRTVVTSMLGISPRAVAPSAAFMSSLKTSSLSVFRVVVKVRRSFSVRVSGRRTRGVAAIRSTISRVRGGGTGRWSSDRVGGPI